MSEGSLVGATDAHGAELERCEDAGERLIHSASSPPGRSPFLRQFCSEDFVLSERERCGPQHKQQAPFVAANDLSFEGR